MRRRWGKHWCVPLDDSIDGWITRSITRSIAHLLDAGIATAFAMRTIPTPERVQQVYVVAPQTVESIAFYQSISTRLSDKVTLNLEVTHGYGHGPGTSSDVAATGPTAPLPPLVSPGLYIELVGIYLGDADEFMDELERLGVDESSPIPISRFRSGLKETTAADAQLELMGWENSGQLDDLLKPYSNENTYYSYVSVFLYEPLDEASIKILMEAATWNTDGSSLVYEFQSLGGGPERSAVARVGVTDTAFSHRAAQFGLLMKSNAREPLVAGSLYGRMREAYDLLLQNIGNTPPPVYVNMVDIMLLKPSESYYGIPGNMANGDATVERLTALATVTNSNSTLTTIQSL